MASEGNTLAVKLKDVAQVFASLAAFYVEDSIRKANADPSNRSSHMNVAASVAGSTMGFKNSSLDDQSTFSMENSPNFEFNFSVENNP
jgi:hypothetical protein